VDRGERYSRKVDGKSSGRTVWLGMNLSASALGVSSVWMKMVRRACVLGARGREFRSPSVRSDGRCVLRDADIGDVRGESLNDRTNGTLVETTRAHRLTDADALVGRLRLFARLRTAVFEAMLVGRCVVEGLLISQASTSSWRSGRETLIIVVGYVIWTELHARHNGPENCQYI
jgi:hypothetical protein